MSRRHRTLKQAFLVTVTAASVATGSAACGDGQFAFDDDGTTTNPPAPCFDGDCGSACPASQPADGTVCFGSDLECYYGSDCDEMIATCDGGTWSVYLYGTCNPPPPTPDCPAEAPVVGTLCAQQPDGYPTNCNYAIETPCGPDAIVVGCAMDTNADAYVWTLQSGPSSCTVSPEECQLYGEEIACGADSGCQWLVPSCEDGPNNVVEGCYPAGDCTTTGCGDWGACLTMVHDPCHGSLCEACAGEIPLCIEVDTAGP